LKSCCVVQDHYDDERDKTVFHNTTPDLQDQDQDRFFWSRTGFVLTPTVSITSHYWYGSISCRFSDIQCRKISRPWNPSQGSSRSL